MQSRVAFHIHPWTKMALNASCPKAHCLTVYAVSLFATGYLSIICYWKYACARHIDRSRQSRLQMAIDGLTAPKTPQGSEFGYSVREHLYGKFGWLSVHVNEIFVPTGWPRDLFLVNHVIRYLLPAQWLTPGLLVCAVQTFYQCVSSGDNGAEYFSLRLKICYTLTAWNPELSEQEYELFFVAFLDVQITFLNQLLYHFFSGLVPLQYQDGSKYFDSIPVQCKKKGLFPAMQQTTAEHVCCASVNTRIESKHWDSHKMVVLRCYLICIPSVHLLGRKQAALQHFLSHCH